MSGTAGAPAPESREETAWRDGILALPAFDPAALPRGRAARLAVTLLTDALGGPLRVPMLALRGREDGPVFGLTAALHGNEINGVLAIHRLFRQLESLAPEGPRGTIAALLVANPPGFQDRQRAYGDGVDLNHVMPGRPDGNASQLYAHRLLQRVVARFDALVDLHTASEGRVNSLYVRADLARPDCAHMAQRLQPQIILHSPPSDTTLRGAYAASGRPAITVEIGDPQRYQPLLVDATVAGLRRLLADAGLLPATPGAEAGAAPIVCRRSRWLYTDEGGLLEVLPPLAARVAAGERVAVLRDVYGRRTRTYEAPEAGVVIGRSVDPVGPAGARILHLGIEGEPDEDDRAGHEGADGIERAERAAPPSGASPAGS